MIVLKKGVVFLAVLGTLMFLAAPAVADWDPDDPNQNTKWVQLPDLTPNGIDVKVTDPKILADDWMCLDPRPVTDIHLWGSWKNDILPETDPAFRVQIWSDQPADASEYSRPKEFLWEATDFTGTVREYWNLDPDGPGEGWYDPNIPEYLPSTDWTIWQLNLDVSKNPFHQVEGSIYWLVVQAWFPDGTENAELGWKTTDPNVTPHWNDDAVWADGDLLPGTSFEWNELRYPEEHPYVGESMDLSFVITVPEPGTLTLLAMAGLGLLLFAWRRRK